MNITYYGQSCYLIDTGAHRILFDPFISGNELAKHIDVESIQTDFICQSHGHTDHILDCEAIAKRTKAQVICSWEIHEWLQKKGISNTMPMNIGGSMQFEFGQLKCVSAVHSSSLPDGSYGGCAMGFVLTVDDKRIYYAGDTALTLDMKLIGEYWRPDIALLPIGNHFTMDATDAIIAASFVQCKEIIGMHYDTFGFIKIDHALTQQLFNEAGLSLTLMQIGESKTI